MPMRDANGRWHDDRGRFMKVASALAAVEQIGHSGGVTGQRGSLSRVAGKLAKAAEPKRPQMAKQDHHTALSAMTSREDARQYLAGVKGKELDALMRQLDLGTTGTADQKRSRILQATVGARLDSNAIGRRSASRSREQKDADLAAARRSTAVVDPTGGHRDPDVTPEQRAHELGGMETREEAAAYLANVKGGDLEALARHYNVQHYRTAAERRSAIIERTVGARQNSAVLRGGTWDAPQASESVAASRAKAVQDAVRESAARHANRGGWAGIADIRDDLAAAGYTREEQDNALRAMMSQPDVRIVPVADRKNLRPRDRAAALVVGRDDLTAIQVGGDPTVPEVRTQVTVADLRADLAARERQLRLDTEAGASEDLLANHRAAIADLRQQIASASPKAPPESSPAPRRASRGQLSQVAGKLASAARAEQAATPRASRRRTSKAPKAPDDRPLYLVDAGLDQQEAAAQYRTLIASVPDSEALKQLPDEHVMDLFAQVTAVPDQPDPDTFARLSAELDRRTAAEAAHGEQHTMRAFLARPVADMTEDDLDQAARYASALGDEPAIERIFTEWERRDREQAARSEARVKLRPSQHRSSTPEEIHRIDQLVSRGRDYLDAYAEVHNLDPDKLRREQAGMVAAGGKPTRTAAAIRRAYDEHVTLQYLDAETATSGHLLSKAGVAKRVDPRTLFSGPMATARKYASEELLRYWQANPRMMLAEFTANLTGRANTARKQRLAASSGRDFV